MPRRERWKQPASGISLPRRILGGAAGLLLLVAGAAAWLPRKESSFGIPLVHVSPTREAAPMCPWREPESDLRALFPAANRRRTEVRILSGQRLELAKRLGRAPAAEEMALYFHRVYRGDRPLGTVLVRRVKGEYGAIEVVVGVGTDGKVRGVRLQRLREPEPIAEALRSPAWLGSFAGKTVAGAWTLGRDVPDVPAAARPSARAVMEGARSLVILLEVAERRGLPSEEAPHHH